MTITQLLSHHGLSAPRWVDVDGRITFDKPAAAATTTLVQPHTFHGGEDPEDLGAADSSWWHDEAELDRHVTAVKAAFPKFHYIPSDDHDEPPFFAGLIDTGRGTFKVLVGMRHDGGLPVVRVIGPRLGRQEGRVWRKPLHIYTSGGLCIADQDDWIRGEHTAATAIAWTAHWLAAYTEWRFSGRWPIDGYKPNAA